MGKCRHENKTGHVTKHEDCHLYVVGCLDCGEVLTIKQF